MDLDALMEELVGMIGQEASAPSSAPSKGSDGAMQFQNPIRGGYANSGDFSPNAATDKRHLNGHQGVDLRAPAGTAIYPVLPGTVSNVGSSSKGGNTVTVMHPNGFRSYYAHCSTIKVQKGDKVNHETVIATVGDSGNAKGTPPHLHFQLWKGESLVNPGSYISVPKFTPVQKGEQFWLSEKAKEQDKSFSMKDHLTPNKSASSKVDEICALATSYFELTKD